MSAAVRHIEDRGICLNPAFMRTMTGVPTSLPVEVIEEALKPAPSAIHGTACISTASLSKPAKTYYDAITSLVARSRGPVFGGGPPSVASQVSIPLAKAPSWGDAIGASSQAVFGASPQKSLFDLPPPARSPFGQSPLSQSPLSQSPLSPSPFGQSPFGQSPFGQSSLSRSPFGQASPPSQSTFSSLPREVDNPYHFLRSARVPLDVSQQLAYLNRPVEFGSFFAETEDLKAQFHQDYRQTYDRYLGSLPYGDRMQYGGDPQNSNMYQLMLITAEKEKYLMEIERIDKLLMVKTPEQVRNLTFTQLMQYLATRKMEMQTQMNTWFYNQGIVVAATGLGNVLDGRTGVYYLDRYTNLRSFPSRMREMRGNPWWEYSLQQLSAGSGIGASPGTAMLFMIGMAFVGAAQEGASEFKLREQREEEEERRRALADARPRREGKKKDVDDADDGDDDDDEPAAVEKGPSRIEPVREDKENIAQLVEGVTAL